MKQLVYKVDIRHEMGVCAILKESYEEQLPMLLTSSQLQKMLKSDKNGEIRKVELVGEMIE